MKYIKYTLAYIALTIQITYVGLIVARLLGYIHITLGNSQFIFWLIIVPSIYIYNKYKPFKLTGNLDLYIKKKWNDYFDNQKNCPNCDKVVSKEELTSDGKCKYCK